MAIATQVPLVPPPAAVAAGSQISFVANLQGQPRWDTLNSTLLAQVSADAQENRYSDPETWYKSYVQVLGEVGWGIQSFNFTPYETSSGSFDVNTVILEALAEIATEEEIAVVSATLAAVQADPSGDAGTLWNTETHDANQGNFQIGVASDSNGAPVMRLAAFYFNTSNSVTSLSGFEFGSSSTTFMKAAEIVSLDEQIYSQVRQVVLDKLGPNAQQLIAGLQI